MSYGEAVNYLLKMYPTGDIIAEVDAYMKRITQRSNKRSMKYTKALRSNVLRCNRIYDE